jgi:hypothetical protein
MVGSTIISQSLVAGFRSPAFIAANAITNKYKVTGNQKIVEITKRGGIQ